MTTPGGKVLGAIKAVFFVLLMGVLSTVGYTQIDSALLRRISCFSLGITAAVQGPDVGIGLEATSRPIFKRSLSLRARGGLNWLESYKAQTGDDITYPSFAAALVCQLRFADRVRFYFETGPFVLFPSVKFSDRSSVTGVYLTTGAELFARVKPGIMLSYFLGGGVAVCDAKAEKLENEPIARFNQDIIYNWAALAARKVSLNKSRSYVNQKWDHRPHNYCNSKTAQLAIAVDD